MLTIKHVEHGGHEGLQQCTSISYTPKNGGHPDDRNPRAQLIAFGCTAKGGAVDEHGVCRYGDGMVYVMNETGATVGKYDLD